MRLPFFRSKDAAPAAPARPAPGGEDARVQAARTQARRRLVGALVLLLAGVVGFPVLFETQPRPLPVDTPILVPEGTPARVAAPAPQPNRPAVVLPPDAGTEAALAPAVAAASAPAVPASQAAAPAQVASQPKPPAPAVVAAVAPKPAASAASKPAKAAPAPASAAATGRFVVQVGAYNDIERLKAARSKLEKMGLKSYTQDVDTTTGKRTRVRVGPFPTRQEADGVAARLKAAGMQAVILSL